MLNIQTMVTLNTVTKYIQRLIYHEKKFFLAQLVAKVNNKFAAIIMKNNYLMYL